MFVMPTEKKRVMTKQQAFNEKITHLIRGWFLLAQITLPVPFFVGLSVLEVAK
jgi:hypothetical protein